MSLEKLWGNPNCKCGDHESGKFTRDTLYPNHARKAVEPQEAEVSSSQEDIGEFEKGTTSQEFVDMSFLWSPTHTQEPTMDVKFAHFIEMI